MSQTTRNLIKQAEEMQNAQQSDMMYFIDKALAYCDSNDINGVRQQLKRLKLMEDALITYRLTRKEIDWKDTSLGTKK